MIKSSTIDKKKQKVSIATLKQEVEQRGKDIELLAQKCIDMATANDKLRRENEKLKSHWIYKLLKW